MFQLLFDVLSMLGADGQGEYRAENTANAAANSGSAQNGRDTSTCRGDRAHQDAGADIHERTNNCSLGIPCCLNGRRPHSSLDGMTPDQAYFTELLSRMGAYGCASAYHCVDTVYGFYAQRNNMRYKVRGSARTGMILAVRRYL